MNGVVQVSARIDRSRYAELKKLSVKSSTQMATIIRCAIYARLDAERPKCAFCKNPSPAGHIYEGLPYCSPPCRAAMRNADAEAKR
jgi:hypothetical protein